MLSPCLVITSIELSNKSIYLPFYQLLELDHWNTSTKHLLTYGFPPHPNTHALLSLGFLQSCSHPSHSNLLCQQDLPGEAALGTPEKLNQQGCSRQLANHYLGRRWWIQLVLLVRLPVVVVVVASCPEFNISEKEEEVFAMTSTGEQSNFLYQMRASMLMYMAYVCIALLAQMRNGKILVTVQCSRWCLFNVAVGWMQSECPVSTASCRYSNFTFV